MFWAQIEIYLGSGRQHLCNGLYAHKVSVGLQVQLHMGMLLCWLFVGFGGGSGSQMPRFLLVSTRFPMARARCMCGLVMRADSFSLWVTHINWVWRYEETQVGVFPYGFQFTLDHLHLTFSFSSQLQALLTCSPFTVQYPLKIFVTSSQRVEGLVPIINPLFRIALSGSACPVTPWLIHMFDRKKELQVRRLDSSPSFPTA